MQNSRTVSIATNSPSRMEPLCATGRLRLTGSCSPGNIATPAPHGPGFPRQDPSVLPVNTAGMENTHKCRHIANPDL